MLGAQKIHKITSLNGKAPRPLKRLIRYALIGIIGVGIDIILFIFLRAISNIGWMFAAQIAFLIGTLFTYIINKKWTFRKSKTSWTKGLICFFAFTIISINFVIFIFKNILTIPQTKSILIISIAFILAGLINFTLNYFITFKDIK